MTVFRKDPHAVMISLVRLFSFIFALIFSLCVFLPLSSAFVFGLCTSGISALLLLSFYIKKRIRNFLITVNGSNLIVRSGFFRLKHSVLSCNKVSYIMWLTTPLESIMSSGIVIITYPGSVFVVDCFSREDYENRLLPIFQKGGSQL